MLGLFSGKQTETLLKNFIAQCPASIAELNEDMCIVSANPAFNTLCLSDDTATAESFAALLCPADSEIFAKEFSRIVQGGEPCDVSANYSLVGGVDGDIIISLYFIPMKDDETTRIFIYLTDVTEQKNLEMRFAHSQKMQAVGQLAGGVAHDFNNLLTAMIGFCDLLLMRHPAGDPSFADIMQIKQNANRAANLVRQLLAFSRRQTLQPKEIDLTDLLSEISNLVRRLIGENIDLTINHERDLWAVKVDQGQMEQVLINLAVNARDAMKDGGALSIATENVTIHNDGLDDPSLRMPPQEDGISAGDYVAITVTDNGTGIPDHVIENIFEPFFSTKEVGSGTGLGLSTVYGIVKQTGGHIYLKTEDDVGTSFVIFIPRYLVAPSVSDTTEKPAKDVQDLTGAATILLVEDETPVRIFAVRALQNKGYEVLEADCAEAGIEAYEMNKDRIEVIVTDVVMPGMNGAAMVEHLDDAHHDRMQHVQVIFMSGYAEEAFADGYNGDRDFNFLAKPFTLKQLAAKIKEITQA